MDDEPQPLRTGKPRCPRLHMMVTSPKVSVVEASSTAPAQCRDYRRLVALIKGPDAQTFAVDIFRVKGGAKHDYRIFSELAASDAKNGSVEFTGLTMPPEPPLPQVGASAREEDIFGLRGTRTVEAPPDAWQAVWRQRGRRYRLWMLGRADAVDASNGPGQETWEQAGRRVRYVDAIRKGENLSSTFAVVHEPSGLHGAMPVKQAVRLDVPGQAGPDAVALRIESRWGVYRIFSEFRREVEIEGIRFKGKFGLLCETPEGRRWLLTSGAETLRTDGFGFEHAPAFWSGKATEQTEMAFITDCNRPTGWERIPEGVTDHVLVKAGKYTTGFPVRSTARNRIAVDSFPLPRVTCFELPGVRYEEIKSEKGGQQ